MIIHHTVLKNLKFYKKQNFHEFGIQENYLFQLTNMKTKNQCFLFFYDFAKRSDIKGYTI